MSNYTKNTNFTAKDTLTSGDPAKVIKGAEFDTEFNSIQTAVNSKADSNNSQLTGTTDAQAVETTGDVTVGGNLSVTGNATIEGNLTFGNADTDTVSFVADVDSSIIPDDDNTYDLGSATKQWRNVYVDGTANIDSLVADTADINGGTIDGVSISGSTASFSGEISANGGIALGDNDKATFGASDDLQIYHDGVSSYIKDSGSGNLNLTTNGTGIWMMNDAGTETMAKFIQNGAVAIYHNNAEKLATTATGVDVTGTVTADGLTVEPDTGNTIVNIKGGGDNSYSYLRMTSKIGGTENYSDIYTDYNASFIFKHDNGNKLASFDRTGDVSFYEDTGTTAKFVWDSSAETLNVGGSINYGYGVNSGDKGFGINSTSTAQIVMRGTEYRLQGVNPSPMTFYTTNSERMRIHDSGKVSIGTQSPYGKFYIVDPSDATLRLRTTDGTDRYFDIDVNTTDPITLGTGSNHAVAFKTNGTERARLDSSGEFLVGTTSYPSGTVFGTRLNQEGAIECSRDGNISALFNRSNSDGEIVRLQKDGSTVGSIGTRYDDIYIGNSGTGITMDATSSRVKPCSPASSGVLRDNAIDLGDPSARFKDLYLSGGVYLGGTGAANKLDDYEEGTYSVQCGDNSTFSSGFQTVLYTKIGNLVTCTSRATNAITTGLTGTDVARFSLPFIAKEYSYGTVFVRSPADSNFNGTQNIWIDPLNAYFTVSNIATGAEMKVEDLVSSGTDLFFTVTYFTND